MPCWKNVNIFYIVIIYTIPNYWLSCFTYFIVTAKFVLLVCEINCKNGTRQGENCSCDCSPGFEGDECQYEIDECIPNPCENNATCSDRVNNYICNCIPGYTGRNCTINIDECAPDPCQNEGTCIDLINGYNCICTEDFNGTQCTNYIGKCPDNYKTGKFL